MLHGDDPEIYKTHERKAVGTILAALPGFTCGVTPWLQATLCLFVSFCVFRGSTELSGLTGSSRNGSQAR